MPVKLHSLNKIKKKLGINLDGPAQAFLTESCYKHMDKYVPMDEGNLRKNVDVDVDKITYQSPYARYQYYGMRQDKTHKVKNYTTPKTGKYWDKKMKSAEINDIVKEVQNFIKRGGN